MAETKTMRAGSFFKFANAMIGIFAGGADRCIGRDDADPEKTDASRPASQHRPENDENPPARPDQ